MKLNKIYHGDVQAVLERIPDESVDCIITSPPYYPLRDYGMEGQIGIEATLQDYLDKMLVVTSQLWRVLNKTGTMFWNHGDSYGAGSRKTGKLDSLGVNRRKNVDTVPADRRAPGYEKSLLLQNFRLAQEMVDRQQWILRNVIVWHKSSIMPASVKDRFTVDFEPVFFFVKNKRYYFEQQFEPAHYDGRKDTRMKGSPKYQKPVMPGQAIQGLALRGHERWQHDATGNFIRNKRSVWTIANQPLDFDHSATFPEKLVEPLIQAGCPRGGIVLDPFMGSGTTAVVAKKFGRKYVGIELNKKYIEIAETRLAQEVLF